MSLRLGFSLFPYYITREGLRPDLAPPLPELLSRVAAAGYSGVPVEIPAGMAAADYRGLLDEYGLSPAPGYFQADFSDADAAADTISAARSAAVEHRALGLERIFIAQRFPDMERFAAPGQGANADSARLHRVCSGLDAVASAMVEEGVVPCLHPHIGSLIETEAEFDTVLGAISDRKLLFGPDVGHLAWSGADPVAVLTRYRDRIGAVHVKDIHLSAVRDGREKGFNYRETGWSGLWTSPGHGDIDYASVMDVLRGLAVWVIAEIDIPDHPTVEEVAERAFAWLSPRLQAA